MGYRTELFLLVQYFIFFLFVCVGHTAAHPAVKRTKATELERTGKWSETSRRRRRPKRNNHVITPADSWRIPNRLFASELELIANRSTIPAMAQWDTPEPVAISWATGHYSSSDAASRVNDELRWEAGGNNDSGGFDDELVGYDESGDDALVYRNYFFTTCARVIFSGRFID